MSLSDLNKVLKAFFSKLGTDDQKRLVEEFGAETINIHFNEVWTEDIDPSPAQAVTDGTAEARTLFALTEDVTVANKEAWRAIDGVPLVDWIPPDKFGSGFITNLFDGNDDLITLASQIVQGITFDHKTGILTINGDPNIFVHPFKITAHRYIGTKGGDLAGGTPFVPGDVFACLATVSAGDTVYISSDDTVEKAFAGAGGGQTPDAIGIVVDKPTATTARVLPAGLSPAIFTGLLTGITYYVSDVTPGEITSVPPASPGDKIQEVGLAASPTRLFIDVDSTSVEL